MLRRIFILILCVLCVSLAACSTHTPIPGPSQVAIGAIVGGPVTYDFAVRVQVTNIVNLNAANYDITYDPALVSVGNVSDGNVGSTVVPVGAWNVVSPGDLRIINSMPGLTGASGSGYLAQVSFNILSSGNVTLGIGNGTLSNTSANKIPAKWLGTTFASTVIQLTIQ